GELADRCWKPPVLQPLPCRHQAGFPRAAVRAGTPPSRVPAAETALSAHAHTRFAIRQEPDKTSRRWPSHGSDDRSKAAGVLEEGAPPRGLAQTSPELRELRPALQCFPSSTAIRAG